MRQQYQRLACVPLAAVLLAVTAAVQAGSETARFNDAWRSVVARFEQRLTDEKVVGGAIVFTSREHGRHGAYYGVQDLESKVPVSDATIFHWASITKSFTAIAAMQLIDRGMLDPQTPAVAYLPELRAIHSPLAPIEALQVRHLMTHTGGLRGPTWPWGGDQPWHPHEPTQWSQLVAMMPYTEIEFPPGQKYSYSNPGSTFLGRIVEVLSGEDIETYIDKNVLRPLGMHASYFDLTPAHLRRHRSNNYYLVHDAPVANGIDFDTGVTNANGGLNASIADMTRYIEFLSGRTPQTSFPLPRDTLERMWQPVAEVAREADLVESIGYGYFVIDFDSDGAGRAPSRRYIGHTGTQLGFRSFIYVDPDNGAAALIALNTRATENYRQLYSDTRRDIFTMLFSPPRKSLSSRPATSAR